MISDKAIVMAKYPDAQAGVMELTGPDGMRRIICVTFKVDKTIMVIGHGDDESLAWKEAAQSLAAN